MKRAKTRRGIAEFVLLALFVSALAWGLVACSEDVTGMVTTPSVSNTTVTASPPEASIRPAERKIPELIPSTAVLEIQVEPKEPSHNYLED